MELHYFLSTNGSRGHQSFLGLEATSYKDLMVLSGYPREIASILAKECYTIAKKNQLNIHFVHNCLDNSTEGILLPELQTGFINLPLSEKRLDFMSLYKDEALKLYESHVEKAWTNFLKAKIIHDAWEKIYIEETDYALLNQFTDSFIHELFDKKQGTKTGKFYDRFFGSATINGSLDYVDNLSQDTTRYFIKGRPGTGKSTFMKRLAQAAYDKGYHVERYHCSFDPDSLDMVVIRELSLCLFDSTSPHEYFPSQKNDQLLDFYEIGVRPETDERYEKELKEFAMQYKNAISSAVNELKNANDALLQAEKKQLAQMDEKKLIAIRKTLVQRIFP